MVCIGGKASSGVTIGGATGGSTVCGTVTGDSVLWASRPGGMLAAANLKFAGVPVTFQDINGYSAFVLFLGVSSLAFGSSDVSLFKRDSLGKTYRKIVSFNTLPRDTAMSNIALSPFVKLFYSERKAFAPITKTRLYNLDTLKPYFYIVKLGFTGAYIISLTLLKKHRLCVLVRTASPRRF